MIRFILVSLVVIAASVCGCSSDSSDGGSTCKACSASTDCQQLTCSDDGGSYTMQACINKCCVDKCQ